MSGADYEYKAKMNTGCSYDSSKGLIAANGMTILDSATPYAMQAALSLGPITAMVDASSKGFIHYKTGIYDTPDDCGTEINHAVTIVGYSNGAEDSAPYWIVRNSWGNKWGESGYIRLKMVDGAGNCGINLELSYPNIHFMTFANSAVCLSITLFGAIIGLWPILKLSWCKRNDLLFIHEGQRLLVIFSYAFSPLILISAILFACSLGSPANPIWMCYRTGLLILYAIVHIALCVLHYLMESQDRTTGDALRRISNFGKIKTAVLIGLTFIVVLVAFILQLVDTAASNIKSPVDDSKLKR